MMQHTQTHRRDSHQPMEQYQKPLPTTPYIPSASPSSRDSRVILRQPGFHAPSPPPMGSESPGSLSSVSMVESVASYSSDEDEDEEEDHHHHYYSQNSWHHPYRRLSVADMCNPMDQHPLKIDQLTHDEVEVIQAFDQLRQATF